MGEYLTKTPEFATNQVFYSREEVTQWVQNRGRSVGCVVVTKRSKAKPPNAEVYKVVFMCEHGGVYKSKGISSRNTATKKFDCPFQLIALLSAKHNWWTVRVVCDTHNHVLAQYMEGHAYAMRLNETEAQLVEDLSAQNVKPRYILATIKDTHPGNVSTSRTVYNEQQKLKTINDARRPSMQVLMDFFAKKIMNLRLVAMTKQTSWKIYSSFIQHHWKKLDFSPRVSVQYDDIQCDDEVQIQRKFQQTVSSWS